jgi:hypothetical protein
VENISCIFRAMISTTIYTKNYKQGWLGKLGQTRLFATGICEEFGRDIMRLLHKRCMQRAETTALSKHVTHFDLRSGFSALYRDNTPIDMTMSIRQPYIYIFMICFYWVHDFTCRSSLYTHCVALTCLRLLAWFVFIVLNTIVERILKGDGYL